MAATDIKGLHGHNFADGTEVLVAVWEKTPMVYKSGSWIRGGTLTDNKDAYMTSFVDRVFLVNNTDNNFEYNGVYWTQNENMLHTWIAKFIFSHETRMFLYGLTLDNGAPTTLSFPSRVWYSDAPNGSTITWGLQYGYDLQTTAGSPIITSPAALFKTRNIKIGDPLFINYSDAGNSRAKPYIVQSIDSEIQVTLTENITYDSTDDVYWCGGNWFDVLTDDGDAGNGMGLTSNEVILYKKNSVHRYNITGEELRRIKDVPGTTSPRSIVNWGGYSYWWHPSGVYRTSGGVGEKISNPIEDIVEGVADANQTVVVGFVDQIRNEVGMYVGDITLRDGETIDDCAIILNLDTKTWEPRSYDRPIKVAANWLRSSIPELYVGDNASGVFQLNTGTQFKTSDIPFEIELYSLFPAGEDAIVNFNRIRSYVQNGPDIQIFYKLVYKPRYGTEGVWDNDDDWKGLKGTQIGDRVDWYFPPDARASGVKLKIVESGGDESFLLEKLTLYYSNIANF